MTRDLSALKDRSASILYDLGEVNHHNTSRLRDLMIELAQVQAGILALLAADEERYEALRPSEGRR